MDLGSIVKAWLATDAGTCALFGFSAYALWTSWRKLATRWDKWFPLATKVAKWTLYAAAFGVLILFFQALGSNLFAMPNGLFALFGAGIIPLANLGIRRLRPKEKVRRGSEVGTPSDVNKATSKALPSSDFQESFNIGGVNIPRSAEPYHFFVVGSTGSGKSVFITSLIDHLEARGDIAIIVDSGGEFSSRYMKPGRDHILNPFDDRCVPWSPTAEMAGPWDAEALAKSMIPDGVGESKDWNSYAQTLVTSILRRLVERKQLSIKDLLYYVQAAPISELEPLLAGTPAAAQLGSDKTFGSIRTIAANYLGTYAYLEDNANPFSVANFIKAEKPGFLFLTYRDDQLDSLRNMMSCILDIAARTILALPASPTRRVWLIIDEFASIGKVQSIEAVATKARKMGGCLLLGLQSVSQLQDRYGDKAAQTILSCLSSWMVLRCSDAETSEYVSKYIGDSEISRMTRGESSSESGGSDSLNEQIQTQRAVMPVELQRLANLQGFFKLAGDYPICSLKLPFPKKRDKRAKNYVDRDFVARPMLDLIPKGDASQPQSGGVGLVAALPETPAAAPAPAQPVMQEEAAPAKPAPLKFRKNPMDSGPAEFQAILTELAELDEEM
ncbi:signal recognition particle receptor FtsY [Novimethylophilus kurashikiensis]|uniref:Signal recognition particle receptor FtsY n=1 Tax=Novimethylophilus kurashikiensis TaxID=1825523 RepID=A0A2R5FCC7_9PROT|nr:type IV secretion system DNA-binding domain-containing protein [Novimethylophilus kurashikiensis]GBG14294.1 signal recognition particle receptor FtsY [Novimethylophilus kurashikiensis]